MVLWHYKMFGKLVAGVLAKASAIENTDSLNLDDDFIIIFMACSWISILEN